MDKPIRPQWNHPEVKTASVCGVMDEIRAWASDRGVVAEDVNMDEFRAVITLAVLESADAYETCRYIDTFLRWPVDIELIRILDRAFRAMPNEAQRFVREWVMRNAVRFKAQKGQDVRFRVGPRELVGTVVDVVSTEARAFVTIPNVKGVITVLAEDVIKVHISRQSPRNTPPEGGTPIAVKAHAA